MQVVEPANKSVCYTLAIPLLDTSVKITVRPSYNTRNKQQKKSGPQVGAPC